MGLKNNETSCSLIIQLTVKNQFAHKWQDRFYSVALRKVIWKVWVRMNCLYLMLSVQVCVLVGLAFAYHSGKLNEWSKP